jgi:hypothetical protein
MSSSFHINIFMITTEQAMQELYHVAQQSKYRASASYSTERRFVNSYPVQAKPAFIADGLPKQIGGVRRT